MLPPTFAFEKFIAKKLDFNKKEDVKFYLTILKSLAQEEARFGSKLDIKWRIFYSVGVSMKWEHLGSDFYLGTYKILENDKAKGGVCFHRIKTFNGIVINAFEVSSPFSSDFFKLYELGVKLLKSQGVSKIFCYIIKNHPIIKKLPVKLTSDYVPPFNIVSLYEWTG